MAATTVEHHERRLWIVRFLSSMVLVLIISYAAWAARGIASAHAVGVAAHDAIHEHEMRFGHTVMDERVGNLENSIAAIAVSVGKLDETQTLVREQAIRMVGTLERIEKLLEKHDVFHIQDDRRERDRKP